MYYNQTQYALSRRDPDAIVYPDAFGQLTRITADMIDNDEFEIWKDLLDCDFHWDDCRSHVYYNHNISMEDPTLIGLPSRGPEAMHIAAEERAERETLKQQIAIAFFTCLTETQQARLWLHAVEGYTTREIATFENVSQKNIVVSLSKARKNISDFLQNGGYQNPLFAAYSEGTIFSPF